MGFGREKPTAVEGVAQHVTITEGQTGGVGAFLAELGAARATRTVNATTDIHEELRIAITPKVEPPAQPPELSEPVTGPGPE